MNASQAVNEPNFRKLTCLDEDRQFYEVQSVKKRIIMDVPIQLAIFILNLTKLRLLAFTYNEIDRLVDRSDYMLLETDTETTTKKKQHKFLLKKVVLPKYLIIIFIIIINIIIIIIIIIFIISKDHFAHPDIL